MREIKRQSTGFSPGPWRVENRDDQIQVVARDGDWFFVNDNDQSDDRDRANARLIAGAPDLLKELRAAHEYKGPSGGECRTCDLIARIEGAV
ncbi:MAG: hypothetical protein WCB19_02310, partial [Thermoplasmata archaeon]